MMNQNFLKILFTLFIIIGFFSVGCEKPIVKPMTEGQPLNVKLTNAAWTALDNKQYDKAIQIAEDCIDEFEPTALRMQKELERNNTPSPSVGKVSRDEREKIFNRGLLNDVATCWFIKGRSLEKLGKTQEAIRAYCKTVSYTYARTYDPSWDGFWSPSQAASDRISYLKGSCE